MAQMSEPICNGIGLDMRRHFIHEALVREGVLQTSWGPERSGPKGRRDAVRQDTLARHRPRTAAAAADTAGDVRWRRIVAIAKCRGIGRGRLGREGGWLKAGQKACDDIAGGVVAGTIAARRRPRF